MSKEVERLLAMIINNEDQRKQWMDGMNLHFGISPKEMLEAGREQEVINYLMYHIEGPY